MNGILAIIANGLLAGYALKKGSVSPSGGLVGFGIGFLIFWGGGARAWIVLGVFFLTSSFLSKLTSRSKRFAEQLNKKGSRRDGIQAFANGGPEAIALAFFGLTGHYGWIGFFLGSMACATADTWSSEVGVHSSRPPRSILTGRIVDPGTSGGISPLGTLAAVAGSVVIGLSAIPLLWVQGLPLGLFFFVSLLGGILGSFLDSFLGATIQKRYLGNDGRLTEKSEKDGVKLPRAPGLGLLNNDGVNIVSNTLTGLGAYGVSYLFLG